MYRSLVMVIGMGSLWVPLAPAALAAKCSPDSVQVGGVCVDQYEASVWEIPASNRRLIKKVQQGKATLADLTGGGAIQRGG